MNDSAAEQTGAAALVAAVENPWQCQSSGICRFQTELVTLRQQAVTDPLTGLYNLRYLLKALATEIERTERTGLSTSLMMLDLDFFKRVNDCWGHEVGNRVLQSTSHVILETTRRLDISCRYGGEEFAIVLPGSSLLAARAVAERLRVNIAAQALNIDGQYLTVSASIGVTAMAAGALQTPGKLIEKADIQLYRAKQAGRNRVCYEVDTAVTSHVTQDEKDLMRSLFDGG
ncbi:GGDEF domain-containing protein [Candidatus Thalassolituus haligoni]|uniref:GGDEF domain-containing protein n=1 Tax=Candidatus Thalassolituus haligoni TaxID=3100113 RepID=UPI003513D860|tara:strand:+ start:11694 stop:12383 length:690 start_codon:yes stop_codon:yes gene_type:complete